MRHETRTDTGTFPAFQDLLTRGTRRFTGTTSGLLPAPLLPYGVFFSLYYRSDFRYTVCMDFNCKLPIGVRDFEKLREDGYLYVDKTALIYKLVHSGSCYFLCRPRSFGKSLLLSTLEAYFKGRRDLFQGLAIESMEKEWALHTVIKLDFSSSVYSREGALEDELDAILSEYEEVYGHQEWNHTFGRRLHSIIRRAYEKHGKPVALLVDDYDRPIIDALFSDLREHNSQILNELFAAVLSNDFYLKFVFITGISKTASDNFIRGSMQTRDISLYPAYGDLCGITPPELEAAVQTLTAIQEKNQRKKDAAEEVDADLPVVDTGTIFDTLDRCFGGYRFAPEAEMVYNPYSIWTALDFNSERDFNDGQIMHSSWLELGRPDALVDLLIRREYDLFNIIYGTELPRNKLVEYNPSSKNILPLLFQAGYMTIRGGNSVVLSTSMPNAEVVEGILEAMLPHFARIDSGSTSTALLSSFEVLLRNKNVGGFITKLQETIVNPYSDKQRFNDEYMFKLLFHIIANLLGTDVSSGITSSDIMFRVPDGEGDWITYIFALKMDKGLAIQEVTEDAFARIEEKGYEEQMAVDEKKCVKVVVVFSSEKGGIAGWTAK